MGGDLKMAQIRVNDLSFTYEGSSDPVLSHVTFQIDTNWKLGLIGRNGKGKTTLLQLMMGTYDYQGSIYSPVAFDYFPYSVSDNDGSRTASELMEQWKPSVQLWQVLIQLDQIHMDAECLFRPFSTLSFGERTKVMLAVLFAGENEFLLIDEPTNHLDEKARQVVKDYLSSKKGFILVAHDRNLLAAVYDPILAFNKSTIEVQSGNFTSWWANKERSDTFAQSENEKHLKEISKLKTAADRSSQWAAKNESTKIGFDPIKEQRGMGTRPYIGSKTKKMQSRVKAVEKRINREIEGKKDLLQDIERVDDLKIPQLSFYKDLMINVYDLSLRYQDAEKPLFEGLRFQVTKGRRVLLKGPNGCGKSSILKAILQKSDLPDKSERARLPGNLIVEGTLQVTSGLIISYASQDTSFLKGTVQDFCLERQLDLSLFLSVLRILDFSREQFVKDLSDLSEGQKKKILLAASLITPAHLYVWDEPLNYIDVFSRMQIEKLILTYQPTMLLVEHDVRFAQTVATQIVEL